MEKEDRPEDTSSTKNDLEEGIFRYIAEVQKSKDEITDHFKDKLKIPQVLHKGIAYPSDIQVEKICREIVGVMARLSLLRARLAIVILNDKNAVISNLEQTDPSYVVNFSYPKNHLYQIALDISGVITIHYDSFQQKPNFPPQHFRDEAYLKPDGSFGYGTNYLKSNNPSPNNLYCCNIPKDLQNQRYQDFPLAEKFIISTTDLYYQLFPN